MSRILINNLPTELDRTISVDRSSNTVKKIISYRDGLPNTIVESVKRRFHLFRKSSLSPIIDLTISSNSIALTSQYKPAKMKLKNVDACILEREIRKIANEVHRLNRAGLVLGDCVPKNIVFDGRSLWLVDFEPFNQVQMPSGQLKLLATPGWCHQEDVTRKRLSVKTDAYCLELLGRRLFN